MFVESEIEIEVKDRYAERLDDHGRVRVLLELMGGPVRVTLPQTLVAPG